MLQWHSQQYLITSDASHVSRKKYQSKAKVFFIDQRERDLDKNVNNKANQSLDTSFTKMVKSKEFNRKHYMGKKGGKNHFEEDSTKFESSLCFKILTGTAGHGKKGRQIECKWRSYSSIKECSYLEE